MDSYYQSIELKNGIYRFHSLENVLFELLVGKERALLIDTGYGFGDVRKAVRMITDKPLTVVNTHGHMDHTSGNCQFPEEQIYICKSDIDLLKRHNTPQFREKSVRLAEHSVDWVTGKEFNGLPEEFDESSYISGGYGDQICLLQEGQVFDLGGITIRTVATPGHTKGSMSFYYEEEGWLYVGDAANRFLWLFDQDATERETYISTLEKIMEINPKYLWGGHAPDPFTEKDLQQFRRAAIEADYDQGIPFTTPIMEECKDIRICILDGKSMDDISDPDFCAILIDESRK